MPRIPFVALCTVFLQGSYGQLGNDEPESCSCDCCNVVYRSPAEIVDPEKDSNVKCVTRDKHPSSGNVCPATCGLGLQAKVLRIGTTGQVQYSQFCFRECKPYDSHPGNECWRISAEEGKQARTKDQNGKDVNYVPVVDMPPTSAPPLPSPLEVPTVTEQPMVIKPAPPPPTAAESIIHEASSASHSSSESAVTIGADSAEAEKWAKQAEERALKARALVDAWNERNPLRVGTAFMSMAS